jgi:hypothetical protein
MTEAMRKPKGIVRRATDAPSARTRRRAVPNRPAWSHPPREDTPPSLTGPPARDSVRGMGEKVMAWCYLCRSAHRFHEPHSGPLRLPDNRTACVHCGLVFDPRDRANRRKYCTNVCRETARHERRREARERG